LILKAYARITLYGRMTVARSGCGTGCTVEREKLARRAAHTLTVPP
jgi:hypothetical protein